MLSYPKFLNYRMELSVPFSFWTMPFGYIIVELFGEKKNSNKTTNSQSFGFLKIEIGNYYFF